MRGLTNKIKRAYAGMDPVVRRESVRAFFVLLSLSLVGIGFFVAYWYEHGYLHDIRREQLVAEIRAFVVEPLESITVLPDQPWFEENFEYRTTDQEVLEAFRGAARQVHLRWRTGRSGQLSSSGVRSLPVFEATILLRTRRSVMKYAVAVYDRGIEDLHISNTFSRRIGEGIYQSGPPVKAFIPGLGLWMVRFAPDGCSPSIRQNCRSGDFDIDYVSR